MDFESFVLAASTADLDDGTTPVAKNHADAVEFRMDLADEPLVALDAYEGPLPIIATNRVDWEGGKAPDEPARIEALEQAATHAAVEAIDIELQALQDGSRPTVPDGTATIVSVHDFEGTPSKEKQRQLLETAVQHGDVGKLAVTATEPAEVPDLLAVTQALAADGQTVATMAMGEAGRHVRAVAPIYGSRIGYAPIRPDEATAPGQYDLQTLATLIDQLRPQ